MSEMQIIVMAGSAVGLVLMYLGYEKFLDDWKKM